MCLVHFVKEESGYIEKLLDRWEFFEPGVASDCKEFVVFQKKRVIGFGENYVLSHQT